MTAHTEITGADIAALIEAIRDLEQSVRSLRDEIIRQGGGK